MTIIIKNGDIEYTFDIRAKFNYIRANSGLGKTSISTLLRDSRCSVRIDGIEYGAKSVAWLGEDSLGPSNLKHIQDRVKLCFLDEVNWLYGDDSLENELYEYDMIFIAIGRDSIHLPIPDVGVLDFVERGKEHFVYPTSFRYAEYIPYVDSIIVEDANSGYLFFDSYSKVKVISAAGRSKVARVLSNTLGNRLVIIDACGIGAALLEIKFYMTGRSDIIVPRIESYEYMLLKSNLIKWNGSVNYLTTNNIEFTYEFLLNKLLAEVTGIQIRYSKSKLSPCFLFECCADKNYNCRLFGIINRKLKYLFEGTDFDWILDVCNPKSRYLNYDSSHINLSITYKKDKKYLAYLRCADAICELVPNALRLETSVDTVKQLYEDDKDYLDTLYKAVSKDS